MDWNSFGATLAGGLVSIVTSVVVFLYTSARNEKRRLAIKRRMDAQLAFRGFLKLNEISSAIKNLEQHIDEEFARAAKNGGSNADPSAKLRRIVRGNFTLARVEVEEMLFLLEEGKANEVVAVGEIYQRALLYDAMVEEYNERRARFDSFLSEKHGENTGLDGTTLDIKLDDNFVCLEIAVLNSFIGQITERLEEDRKESFRLTEMFCLSAQNYFGEDFPKFQLKWRGN